MEPAFLSKTVNIAFFTLLDNEQENIEKKKAEYAEKMNNKKAEIHKAAEEKKAVIESNRGEDILKVEEIAAKFRATGNTPKWLFGSFSFWFFESIPNIETMGFDNLFVLGLFHFSRYAII